MSWKKYLAMIPLFFGLWWGQPAVDQEITPRAETRIVNNESHPGRLLPRFRYEDVDTTQIPHYATSTSSLRENVNLEFIVSDSATLDPLPQSTVVLQGISDPEYLEVHQTDDQGVTDFSVEDFDFFYSFTFQPSYHPNAGAVFSDANKTIDVYLIPYEEGQWWDYYSTDDSLEFSFSSFDPDIYYDVGDEFNYEIEVGNISDQEVGFSHNDIVAGARDTTGAQVGKRVVSGETYVQNLEKARDDIQSTLDKIKKFKKASS